MQYFAFLSMRSSHDDELDASISAAVTKGIPVVCASGNDGGDIAWCEITIENADGTETTKMATICPAHKAEAITVGAVNNDANSSRRSSSNYGDSLDLVAPGQDILSIIPNQSYGKKSGTSMATPHISAAVAMAKLRFPMASPAELEDLLKYNCVDLGPANKDVEYGHGILDMSTMITNLPFIDISKKDWYYEGVYYSHNRGIMTGMDDFHFAPISRLQRQDFILMLYRSAGYPPVTYRTVFSDVDSIDYYANAAVWAYDNYLMRGSEGKLGVGMNIRREDFATVLYRYSQYRGLNVSERADISAYPDHAGISSYAVEPMQWAVAKGIISGNGKTYALDPAGYADRAAVATMMMRFYRAYGL